MQMFWVFELSFDADILTFFAIFGGLFGLLFPKIGQNFIQFSGHTAPQTLG
jgi:hypothetical protein